MTQIKNFVALSDVDEKRLLTFFFTGATAKSMAITAAFTDVYIEEWFVFIAHRYAYTSYDITLDFDDDDDSGTTASMAVPEGATYSVELSGLEGGEEQLTILKIVERIQACSLQQV